MNVLKAYKRQPIEYKQSLKKLINEIPIDQNDLQNLKYLENDGIVEKRTIGEYDPPYAYDPVFDRNGNFLYNKSIMIRGTFYLVDKSVSQYINDEDD